MNPKEPQAPNPEGCSGGCVSRRFENHRLKTGCWHSRLYNFSGPLFLVCLFLGLTVATWRRWGDILIDFPLHLYTPWRLSQGAVLYRDVINLHGPFSECYHGALFRLFGASIDTLIGASLLLLAAQTILLYRLFKKESGSFIATLICTVFLVVFAFEHLLGIGNYNYILSYNYELIHGLFFSCLTLYFLQGLSLGRGPAVLAGVCFGFALLTKPEIVLALGLAVVVWAIVERVRAQRMRLGSEGWFALGTLVGPMVFFLYFAALMGPKEALGVLLWPWKALLMTKASANAFHRSVLGLDDPLENLAATIQAAGFGVLALLAVTGVCHRRVPKLIQYPLALLILGLSWRFDWRNTGTGFPLLSLGAIALLWFKGHSKERVFPLLWAVFGLGLLAKMGINCRIWHYGYVLAMPTATGLVFIALKTLPELTERYGFNAKLLRLILAAGIGLGTLQLWLDSWQIYRAKTAAFESGQMRTFPPELNARGEAITRAADWLKQNTPAQSTLAAFPQGVILNFLSRRPNPTPYLTWMVTEYNTFGEDRMLASLQAHPPDYIALVHTDTSEYGPRFFGQPGYGAGTARWIVSHYRPVFLAGSEPFRGDQFGIRLLQYNGR